MKATSSSHRRARVLILGDRVDVALAACRALAKAGYHVGVTGSGGNDVPGLSRHARSYHRMPPVGQDRSGWQHAMQAVVASEGYEAVVATSDVGVLASSELAIAATTCPQLSAATCELIDKGRLAKLCAAVDVAYPMTVRSSSPDTDRAVARRVTKPMIVKAAQPAVSSSRGVIALAGATRVHDEGEALAALVNIRRRGSDGLLQEHLPGSKLQVMLVRRDGVTSYRLAMRVAREFPPTHGAESMLEAIPTSFGLGGTMVAAIERLVDAAGYEGFVGGEFILDEATGTLSVIDVNPRLGGALQFPELLGHRLTERVVLDALGGTPPPNHPPADGRRYHHLVREARWLWAQGSWPARYLSTFGLHDVWDIPLITDPMPALYRVRRRLRRSPRTGTDP